MTDTVIETDGRSRAVIPGRPNQRFLMHEQSDGSVLLTPARIVSEAQQEYDQSPELQELLRRADSSPVTRRRRTRR